ncbi:MULTISPECIES: glycine cleavage system protein GcvH [Legionella]|uniref:Glycine cleavage system H protein n=1 Tax=Legionella septentrionalis TaxID=2498109 RepID=A0A433JM69_9GAMM|nr:MULTISPECIES: glycine cleavage system protein GcvH [Legionella]MCP0914745.1 glycine cleavage system protein GcvH [Legionella sp. 27cVA30]RUQ91112.1 glycine cleavage system protein GcvH [Legionella septentrionalis]RUR02819.1 glycine cleavage system protein GcvH [Legionella septentrionalis]RUR11417.1 glycine cleavage system protein GcvH [Legionella septentrionalis]RUR15108.1 glycine cleavage system protein GcvH [Legionella septentrionalis]
MNNIPNNLKYTRTHEWLRQDEEEMTMGITHHAQNLLGDLVFIELPKVGDVINGGDEIGVIESVKAAADFYSPISGVVIAINPQVTENPGLVNKDPYGAGWLIKVKASNFDDVGNLLDAEMYQAEIGEDH